MASSCRGFVVSALVVPALLAGGCDVGSGTGSASGVVSAPDCGLDAEPFDLHPDFFAIDPTAGFAEIRVQHGSDWEDRSDAIVIVVNDTEALATTQLGQPLALDIDGTQGVTMTLLLNETCHVDDVHTDEPVGYIAASGTITFSALYDPSVDDDARETAAVFTDVRFVDPNFPDTRYAVMSGDFAFDYDRSRPAQLFP